MEIDFLGLNSSKYTVEEQQQSKNVFTDTGGVEISLSLCTSSHKGILNFSENKNKKKETWEFLGCDKMIPNSCHENSALLMATPVFHRPSAAGFPYDLNAAARGNSEFPTHPPTSAMLYPQRHTLNFNDPLKADKNVYMAGNASARHSTSGYTPTVAMARKATLARFLEKRSHRMNQGRTSPLMGKPVSVPISEAWESSITISNKKRNNNLKTR